MHALPRPRTAGWVLAAACALLLPATGRADYLPIQYDPNGPTIDSAWGNGMEGTLTYNSTTGQFHSESVPLSITRLDPFLLGQFSSGTVSIDLKVDKNGNFVSNGTGYLLTGEMDFYDPTYTNVIETVGDSTTNPVLLSGDFTAFGLAPGSTAGDDTVQFNALFQVTGGLLTTQPLTENNNSPLYSVNEVLGVMIFAENTQNSPSLGEFSADFSSDSVKADAGPVVPVPPAAVLALTGAAVLFGRAAVRRRKPLAA